jgi:hypothetical protein
MRELLVDGVARMMARSQDRRRLLGVLAGAIGTKSLWPRTTAAASREACVERQRNCSDAATRRCMSFRDASSIRNWDLVSQYVNQCKEKASDCCDQLVFDEDPNGPAGVCRNERPAEQCVVETVERYTEKMQVIS